MMKKFTKFLFLICLAIISNSELLQGQCSTANFQSHRGGVITCNFPFLSQNDIDHFVDRLESTDADVWYEEKNQTADRSAQQWKTTNLRILMLTNSDDIISPVQLETLRLAMNLHLVDLAKANNSDQLEWAHMPIVEEIILHEYPEEIRNMFDMLGYLVFSDPDQRNGETPLNNYVRDLASANKINTIINLLDDPLDLAFRASAQTYCNDPGEFMTVSISKNNTFSLANKYLVQFAQACVHAISHTNYANHQESFAKEESTNICMDYNHAHDGDYESLMVNGTKTQIDRDQKSKPFGNSWSKSNSEQIINTYIQRGLLMPLFDYNNQAVTENADDKEENLIAVFPNPVDEILTIELSNAVQYDLSVYNVNGKLISQQTLESFITQVDVSTYDAGMYIFEFYCANSGERITKKIEKID